LNYITILNFGEYGNRAGEFNYPVCIAIDANDNLYITDWENDRIQKYNSEGRLLKVIPEENSELNLDGPVGIVLDSNENLIVVEQFNNRIQKISPDGKSLQMVGKKGNGPGEFLDPRGIAIDKDDNIYVVDTGNSRIQIFSPTFEMIRKFGKEGMGNGEFYYPRGIALDKEECRLHLEQAEELLGEGGFDNLALEENLALDLVGILIDLKFAGFTKPQVEAVSITELEKAIKSKPDNSDAYYRLFNSYQDSNNSEQALRVLKKLVKNNPKEADAYYLMGQLQYKKKKYKNAQKSLEKFFLQASEIEINNRELTAGWAYLILSVFHRGNKEHTEKLASGAQSFLSEREIRRLSLTETDKKHLLRIIRATK